MAKSESATKFAFALDGLIRSRTKGDGGEQYARKCIHEIADSLDDLMQSHSRWEWITRRLLVLGKYGFSIEYYSDHIHEKDFLTLAWLENYYGTPLVDYIVRDLEAIK